MAGAGDDSLFGGGSTEWGLASKAGGARAFRIRNLDTGQAFHVKNTPMFVDESKLTTFEAGGDDGDGSGSVDAPGSGGGGVGAGTQEGATPPLGRRGPANPGLSVRITGTEPRRDSEGRTFTAYVIRVAHKAQETRWAVVRRYRDFFELDRMVRSTPYRALLATVQLPKKKWFGSMTESVVRERMERLQRYLDRCVQALPATECAAWGTFLELNIKRSRSGYAEAGTMALKDAKEVPGLLSLADAAERFAAYRG